MLAIFGNSVATCPDTFKGPDEYSNSALKRGSLAGTFSTLYHFSHIINVDSSVIFASSEFKPDHLKKTTIQKKGDVFCMFQGEMKHVDILKRKYSLPDRANEHMILIAIFNLLREVKQEAPKLALLDMMGEFSFIIYDKLSKCVMLASNTPQDFPLFWGIDSEHSLVISDDQGIVAIACASTTEIVPKGEVYISCRGRAGLEAIFMDSTPEEENNYQQLLSDLDNRIEETRKTGHPLLPTIATWQPPPGPDFSKINAKGLVFLKDNSIGIGVTIRDWRGKIHMALSKKIKGFTRSIHAEELAIIEGLRMAQRDGLKNVYYESCCLYLLFGWMHCHGVYNELLRSVRLALSTGFSSCELFLIDGDANKAANGLAEYAKEIDDCFIWYDEVPPCISDILMKDSNTEAPETDT